jgi:hypothetical protein
MTRNAKYRATTARSRRECVLPPWYLDSERMIFGKTQPNRADTAGGRIPETTLNVCGYRPDHVFRNGT